MNKKIKKLIGVIMTVCLTASTITIPVFAEEKTDVVENRQDDLDFLYDCLKENHPNIFANTPEEEFLSLKAEIESKIPSESNVNFAFDLEKLAALVGDSHTSVSLGGSVVNEINFYPVEIDWYDGNWYLAMSKGSDSGMLGMKVTSINGIGMNDVLKKISPLISYDNEVKLRRQFTEMCYIADLYDCAGITTDGEPLVLSLTNSQGIKHTLTVNSINESEIDNFRYANLSSKRRTVPATEYDKTKYYFSKALNESTYYIQYNRCSEDADYAMADFCKDIKSDLDNGGYKLVLVDLRNNGGGSDGVIAPLMLMLRQEMDAGLKVAVLVGESTFSAAIINAVEFQEMGCVLVGEPTSGSVDHFGAVSSFKLPNSQFNISVSSKYISLSEYFDAAVGIGVESLVPDVVIPQTIDDYMTGKDTCVEKILYDDSCLKPAEHNASPLTRGRFIGKLYEALGSPQTEVTTVPYGDLFGFEWYIPALNWAKENKIASGTGDEGFYAARTVTWQETAVFMVRAIKALGIEPKAVRDSQVPELLLTNEWSRESVEYAWKWGLIPQNSDFSKAPNRADGKTMIDAFINIK
ncbi:MAG: hypothetical protein VB119_04940 [Candidatus Metalachnospira sp.]|nr:hypothetical protein [Candidatus Metalachnospira sp.]